MNLLNNAIFKVPMPVNEPVYNYEPGSPERDLLKAALDDIAGKKIVVSPDRGLFKIAKQKAWKIL